MGRGNELKPAGEYLAARRRIRIRNGQRGGKGTSGSLTNSLSTPYQRVFVLSSDSISNHLVF